MKLSLAMIARNAEDTIVPCLLSIRDYIDETVIVDTGSTDGTRAAIQSVSPNARIIEWDDPNKHPEKGWISDFSIPRNMSFDACTGDVILWLDADDVVRNRVEWADPGARLRSLIETFMHHADPAADVAEIRYAYKKDDYGNALLDLPRFRVVRKGFFEWVYPVHEDLKPTRFVRELDWRGGDEYIDHRKRDKEEAPSAQRNLWIMQRYMEHGGEMNARLWSNVAGSHIAIAEFSRAIDAYDLAINAKDADDEGRYLFFLRSAMAAQKEGRFDEAVQRVFNAHAIFPRRRQGYVSLAEITMDAGDPERALAFCDMAESMPETDEGYVQNTTALESVPLYTRARAYLEMGHHHDAFKAFQMLNKQFPEAPEVRQSLELLDGLLARQQIYGAALAVCGEVPEEAGQALLRAMPETYRTLPAVARATKPPVPEGKPHMVIYCGRTLDSWGPSSLAHGIGGSEEAVILISREFAALGWHVEVYAFPDGREQGEDSHGVVWLPYSAWEAGDTCDVFVGWRQFRPSHAFRQGLAVGAKQKWLWLHDTIIPQMFSSDWVDDLDGIFCLSKSHAEWLPQEFHHKVVYTTNGLNADYFREGTNQADRFIYASSPDRGLEPLLEDWPQIKAALPNAAINVYYGFTQHWHAAMQGNPELRRQKEAIERLNKAEGVRWHGMVDQETLAQAFADSGFWLYPTGWHETSCITAMKAQAMGAIPITSRFPKSAIPETCKYDLGPLPRGGIIYDDPEWRAEWVAAVIDASQRDDLAEYRSEMKAWAREEFSWSKVAAQWDQEFRQRGLVQGKALLLEA